MKKIINDIFEKIIDGKGDMDFEEAMLLTEYDFEKDRDSLNFLFQKADEIRGKFHGKKFDLCTIVNAKSGNCSEDCRYCAQSSHYNTGSPIHELMDSQEILELAQNIEKKSVDKFSLVTSGKGLSNEEERDKLEKIYRILKKITSLHLCASHGIIDYETAEILKSSGVETYHHNLETSRTFYEEICTTHQYQERVETCQNARRAGMKICSGGIFGLGESRRDRIEMAFELKELQADSVPINILTPIEGTPLALEKADYISPQEIVKTMAIYRFILPQAVIRYAGGRQLLGEYEKIGLRAGINGALTGNYLTTTGSTVERDIEILKEAGFEIKK